MTTKRQLQTTGKLRSYYAGVGKADGLGPVFLHEVLTDEDHQPQALVLGFNPKQAEVIFFDDRIDPPSTLLRSQEVFKIPVSSGYLGRVVDGTAQPLDKLAPVTGQEKSVFQPAPTVLSRDLVNRPLVTGIKVIDATLPLGRGQRELIVGDRKLGKTTLGLDIILNQKNAQPPVACVYVLVGKTKRELEEIFDLLSKEGALVYTTIIAATASDSLAKQYLAPLVGCTIAEYFRDRGQDALIVYDDLTRHAQAFRDINLLLKKPPGREAYPSNIFSLHAGILERAAQLAPRDDQKHGGSLTALPIIETQEGDITAFIPTNLISITDGQIYLEQGLFARGFLPAVNVGLSISRVGSRAQPKPLKKVTQGLRLSLSQYKQLQKLTQLETKVSEETKAKIHRGDLLLQLLKQKPRQRVAWEEQVVLFYSVEEGYWDDLSSQQWEYFQTLLLELMRSRYREVLDQLRHEHQLSPQLKEKIKTIVSDFKDEFLTQQ